MTLKEQRPGSFDRPIWLVMEGVIGDSCAAVAVLVEQSVAVRVATALPAS